MVIFIILLMIIMNSILILIFFFVIMIESIITMLSNAMQEEQENSNSYDIMNDLHEETYDEFDEQPVKVSLVRSKSRVLSKTDFCCVHDHVIRCVCANIIAHIDTTEKSGYVPPDDYQVFNKEGGSLVSTFSSPGFMFIRIIPWIL